MVGYIDPDILMLSETRLSGGVSSFDFLHTNHKGFRRDQASARAAMVAIRDTFAADEVEMVDVSTEIICLKI